MKIPVLSRVTPDHKRSGHGITIELWRSDGWRGRINAWLVTHNRHPFG